MKTIGIKLADGSFYPVLQEGEAGEAKLDLTTAHNNQTRVMVDLYRSSTSSMDDAEYVDTLQIDHMKEHPNGEPSISFVVSIDENKELSARIVDPETGAQSDTNITLVSRTLEERLVTDNYDVSKQEEPVFEEPAPELVETDVPAEEEPEVVDNFEPEIAETAVGAGLLAAAMTMNDGEESAAEEVPAFDEPVSEDAEIPAEETPSIDDELVLPDFEETPAFDEPVAGEEAPVFETTEEPESPESPVQDDFSEEAIPSEEEVPAFDEPVSEDAEIPAEETPSIEEELVLPDFEDDFAAEEAQDDLTIEETPSFGETISEEPLPSFDDLEAPSEDEYKLPIDESDDIDFDIPDVETTIFDENDDDFNLDHILNDDQSDESLPADTGLTEGLYDENGDFAGEDEDFTEEEEEEVSKKTRTPVIICILCAIICLVATALILFVIPSKYNLLGKTKAETEVVETLPEPPAPVVEEKQPEPEIPSAVEDEIIVIEKAEEVLPEPPAPPKVEPEDITYKIKWGDTLWDIADTYYKNPWRYHKIAKYNGIKDPDYIISGTIIKIPVE